MDGFWRRDPGSGFPWEADVRSMEVVMERFQFTHIPLRLLASGKGAHKNKTVRKINVNYSLCRPSKLPPTPPPTPLLPLHTLTLVRTTQTRTERHKLTQTYTHTHAHTLTHRHSVSLSLSLSVCPSVCLCVCLFLSLFLPPSQLLVGLTK